MERNAWVGVMLAGPMLLFPFARSYYLFYVLTLGFAFYWLGWRRVLQHSRDLRLALAAVVLPMVVTILAWGIGHGQVEPVWFEKIAVAILAGLLAMATAAVGRTHPGAARLAQGLIALAVLSWLVDALIQLAFGYDLFGIPASDRLRSYFTHHTKFGFFIGMLVLLPMLWAARRSLWLAALIWAGGAIAVSAGGSRYSMLAFLLATGVAVLLLSWRLRPVHRWAVLLGLPALLVLAGGILYEVNPLFTKRVDQTAAILGGFDYETIDSASSGRLDIWFPAVELAREHWLFGVGPSQFAELINARLPEDNIYRLRDIRVFHTHQVMLEVWLGAGVLGIFAFLALYWRLCQVLVRTREQMFGMGWAAMLAYLVMWFPLGTHYDFYASEMMLISGYLLGLAFAWLQGVDSASPGTGWPTSPRID